MKILYLITSMYNSAGMERTVANKVNYLVNQGHEVTIITTDQANRDYFYDICNTVKKVDFDLNFSVDDNKNIVYRTFRFWSKNRLFKKKMEAYLNEYKQDIVISLIIKSSDFLYKLNDESVKIIEHHFSRKFYSLIGSANKRNWLERFVYFIRDLKVVRNLRKMDCFVVLTHEDAVDWKKVLNNVVVMPNSISFNKDLKAELNNKLIISVGRLEYQKGYDMLIPLWKKVVLKHPDWKLCLYGNGKLKPILLSLIHDYGLANSVLIMDPVKRIDENLLRSSIYVLSSRFEGLPMVLLESMSLGLPPIAFKCKCGPSDVIVDGVNGYLVDCFDVNEFANKIIRLIENVELRKKMGEEAKRTMEEYSHEVLGKKWEQLFVNLIHQKKNIEK